MATSPIIDVKHIATLIEQGLVAHVKQVRFAPFNIFCINLSIAACDDIRGAFPNSQFNHMDLTNVNDLTFPPGISQVDFLVANLSLAASVDINHLLRNAKTILRQNGFMIFATIDHDTKMSLKDSNEFANLHDDNEIIEDLNYLDLYSFLSVRQNLKSPQLPEGDYAYEIFMAAADKRLKPYQLMMNFKKFDEDSTAEMELLLKTADTLQESADESPETEAIEEEAEEASEEIEKEHEKEHEGDDEGEHEEDHEEGHDEHEDDHEEEHEGEHEKEHEGEHEELEGETSETEREPAEENAETDEQKDELEAEKTHENEEVSDHEEAANEIEQSEAHEAEEKEQDEESEADQEESEDEEENEVEVEEDETEENENEDREEDDEEEQVESESHKEHEGSEEANHAHEVKHEEETSHEHQEIHAAGEALEAHAQKLENQHEILQAEMEKHAEIKNELHEGALTDKERQVKQDQLKKSINNSQAMLKTYQIMYANQRKLFNNFMNAHEKALQKKTTLDQYEVLLAKHKALLKEHDENIEQHLNDLNEKPN